MDRRGKIVACLATVVLAVLIPFSLRSTYALNAACRSDPVVQLSNGLSVTLYETINTSAANVQHIGYILHVPIGVKMVSIAYSGDVSASLQSFTFYADENPGNYDSYTDVATAPSSIQMQAYIVVGSTKSVSTVGPTPNSLHNHVHLS